jgi:hypothetical protein
VTKDHSTLFEPVPAPCLFHAPRLYFYQKILRTRLFGHHVYLVHTLEYMTSTFVARKEYARWYASKTRQIGRQNLKIISGSKHRRKLLILLTLFPRRKHGILDPSDNCTLLSSSSFQAMTESKVSSLVKSLTTKDPTASL